MQPPPNPRGLLPGLDGSPTLLKPNTVLHLVLSQPSPSLLPWFTLGRWLGFGFITFEAEQSVDQAVNMHFHDIMGKKVCSCSFILPIKSSRVLGDSKSLAMIPAAKLKYSHNLLWTHSTSHSPVLAYKIILSNVIKPQCLLSPKALLQLTSPLGCHWLRCKWIKLIWEW